MAVPVVGRDVVAQVWRVDVGRVPLLLLDTDRPENSVADRWITSRLYVGDPEVRLWQYALLGVGGVRVLHALGIQPGVVHLNEGHAALAGLEVARAATELGVSGEDALAAARERTVFTTHTPVPAGNDTYPAAQIAGALAPLVGDLGLEMDALVRRGRTHPDEAAEPFGVTQFALRSSRRANAVSARHGEVAREMWQDLWPDREIADVPISHVTNGVHIPTWIGVPMRELFDRHLGAGWMDHATDPATWAGVDSIPAEELWAARVGAAPGADRARARAQRDRPPRPRRHARVRPGRRRHARPRRADARLRPPRRDLQAARPAAERGRPRDLAARRQRPPGADADRRQGAPEGRRGQAPRPAPVRAQEPAGGRQARRLPRRLRLPHSAPR